MAQCSISVLPFLGGGDTDRGAPGAASTCEDLKTEPARRLRDSEARTDRVGGAVVGDVGSPPAESVTVPAPDDQLVALSVRTLDEGVSRRAGGDGPLDVKVDISGGKNVVEGVPQQTQSAGSGVSGMQP